jgi:hypothetical protein
MAHRPGGPDARPPGRCQSRRSQSAVLNNVTGCEVALASCRYGVTRKQDQRDRAARLIAASTARSVGSSLVVDLAARHGELVAQLQDLQVLGGVATGKQRQQLDGAAQGSGKRVWAARRTASVTASRTGARYRSRHANRSSQAVRHIPHRTGLWWFDQGSGRNRNGGGSLKSPPRPAGRSGWGALATATGARSTLAVVNFKLAPTSSASISVTERRYLAHNESCGMAAIGWRLRSTPPAARLTGSTPPSAWPTSTWSPSWLARRCRSGRSASTAHYHPKPITGSRAPDQSRG